jgi:hypothetical protein
VTLLGLHLPVCQNEKRTDLEGWSNPDLVQPEIPAGYNQALRLERLTDIDLDCAEAVAVAAVVLADTPTCSFGRSGRGASHYLFEVTDADVPYEAFKDVDGSMLLEIRHGFGHYTVVPPSRVKRKDDASIIDELVYVSAVDPIRVSLGQVRMVGCVIATISLLTRHWRKSGRHNGLLALAGFLARVNVPKHLAVIILEEITRHGEGHVWDECRKTVSDTYAKHAAGGKTTGGGPQGLAAWLGADVVARLGDWFKVETASAPRELRLVSADTIEMQPVRWFWQDRVPLGSFGLIPGREGIGKSMLSYTLAADTTRGRLDGVFKGQPRSVIICATEDSWAHTITPRLRAAGADLSKVYRVDVITKSVNVELSLPSDVEALTAKIVERGDVALVLLDPLIARLASKLDTHKDAEVRQALEPISRMADEVGAVVLGIIHVNKGSSRDPLNMVMGSRAFAAVARFAIFVALDPDDEERRLVGQVKNNLGRMDLPTLSFTIADQLVATTAAGDEIRTGKLVWGADDDRSIRDVIGEAASKEREKKDTPRVQAEEWLSNYLGDFTGPVLREEVMAAAEKAGHHATTLKRAVKELGIVSTPAGRKTMWALPAQQRLALPEGAASVPRALDQGPFSKEGA